ncbi:MAG: hypothetical protein ACKOEE_12280, partial [Tagaea sp.]
RRENLAHLLGIGVAHRIGDGPHPPARGQRYTLRVGAFFDLADGKIARVSNHYNVKAWLDQVR